MELSVLQTALLSLLIAVVLALPLTLHKVEENLEIFLFLCGISAVSISHTWSGSLVLTALEEPIKISIAVLVASWLFRRFHAHLQKLTLKAVRRMGLKGTIFLLVILLGFSSSLITAIVAALILSEAVIMLPLNRQNRIRVTVLACYAIGMGAILTAIGEPLGTVVISKLKGAPHYAGFFYLVQHLGGYVTLGILLIALLATRVHIGHHPAKKHTQNVSESSLADIAWRAGKVYLFVMALVFLGEGLRPLAMRTISHLSADWLYWINTLSAVLDNATLAAIEVTPNISDRSITFLLMSLIISGGMMIPGNIPNIICASKLGIKSKEWVLHAWKLGTLLMAGFFVLLHILL